jgi:tetratricopeptide (TPR) repeat protein
MLNSTYFCRIPKKNGYGYKWPKLEELALACDVHISGLHDSSVDVLVTGLCLKWMVENGILVLQKNPDEPENSGTALPEKYSELNIDLEKPLDFDELPTTLFRKYQSSESTWKKLGFEIAESYEKQNEIENALKVYIYVLNKESLNINYFHYVIQRISIILRKMKKYEHDIKLLEYAINRMQNNNSNKEDFQYVISNLEDRLEKSRAKVKR